MSPIHAPPRLAAKHIRHHSQIQKSSESWDIAIKKGLIF